MQARSQLRARAQRAEAAGLPQGPGHLARRVRPWPQRSPTMRCRRLRGRKRARASPGLGSHGSQHPRRCRHGVGQDQGREPKPSAGPLGYALGPLLGLWIATERPAQPVAAQGRGGARVARELGRPQRIQNGSLGAKCGVAIQGSWAAGVHLGLRGANKGHRGHLFQGQVAQQAPAQAAGQMLNAGQVAQGRRRMTRPVGLQAGGGGHGPCLFADFWSDLRLGARKCSNPARCHRMLAPERAGACAPGW